MLIFGAAFFFPAWKSYMKISDLLCLYIIYAVCSKRCWNTKEGWDGCTCYPVWYKWEKNHIEVFQHEIWRTICEFRMWKYQKRHSQYHSTVIGSASCQYLLFPNDMGAVWWISIRNVGCTKEVQEEVQLAAREVCYPETFLFAWKLHGVPLGLLLL